MHKYNNRFRIWDLKLEVSENVNEIRSKTNNNIVNEAYELKVEEFAWYQLFPYGKNGLKEQRPVNISPLNYYQFRLLGADARFQRNDYIFYALSMFEYYRIKSTIVREKLKVKTAIEWKAWLIFKKSKRFRRLLA